MERIDNVTSAAAWQDGGGTKNKTVTKEHLHNGWIHLCSCNIEAKNSTFVVEGHNVCWPLTICWNSVGRVVQSRTRSGSMVDEKGYACG
jgi:hypothetical protein